MPGIGIARSLTSARTVASVERLTRSDRKIASTTDQWHADRWAINCHGRCFVVADKSLSERQTAITDFTRRSNAVVPAGRGTEPKKWLEFLCLVQPDEQIRTFLQRVAGYCLTGSVAERCFFFFYAPKGDNGKSTFVTTLQQVMGDYSCTMPMGALMETEQPRHETELARLAGIRLASAAETADNRYWDESKIKNLTATRY